MATVSIKHMRRVKAKGRVYWYHRRTGDRLPDDETARILRVLEINEGLETPSRRVKVGSVEAVANVYRANAAFKNLAPSTRQDYDNRLKLICSLWGNQPITAIQRKHVMALQDRFTDKPATADRMVTVLRVLLAFAVKREMRTDNPAVGIGKLRKPSQVEGHKLWPDWAIEKFRSVHDGNMMGMALTLGLYTGQREGDVLRMRWSDIKAGYITVKQGKTGTVLELRLHRNLVAALEGTEKRGPFILTTERARPFTASNFRHHFAKAVKAAGLGGLGYSFHGLRYTAAVTLADLGLSTHQIAAVTGHKSLAMIAKYTRGAEQRRLGEAAIIWWEEHPANGKVENRADGIGKLPAKGLKNGTI